MSNKYHSNVLENYETLEIALEIVRGGEGEEEIRNMLDKAWLELSDADREHLNNRQVDGF